MISEIGRRNNQIVPGFLKREKIESKEPRDRPDADSHIGLPACHKSRDFQMGTNQSLISIELVR